MVVEWNISSYSYLSDDTRTTASNTREWAYFSSPEDGARKTKGWFKVIPDEDLDAEKYDDAEEFWYFSDGSGNLYANVIKTISGKKYAFDEYGRMMDGLRLVDFAKNTTNNAISTKDIESSYEDDTSATYNFETEDNLDATIKKIMEDGDANKMAFMYFGEDGSVKTGKQSIDIRCV